MMCKKLLTISIIQTIIFVLPVNGAVIHVPSTAPTIQDGINSAGTGDTVLVADGVYTGAGNKNLDFCGKQIVVISDNGPASCIIDCEGDGQGFNFHSGEGRYSRLEGFTICNGLYMVTGEVFIARVRPLSPIALYEITRWIITAVKGEVSTPAEQR